MDEREGFVLTEVTFREKLPTKVGFRNGVRIERGHLQTRMAQSLQSFLQLT
jgi:hypothetical protein